MLPDLTMGPLGNPLHLFQLPGEPRSARQVSVFTQRILFLGSCDTKSMGRLQSLLVKVPTMEVLFHGALRR